MSLCEVLKSLMSVSDFEAKIFTGSEVPKYLVSVRFWLKVCFGSCLGFWRVLRFFLGNIPPPQSCPLYATDFQRNINYVTYNVIVKPIVGLWRYQNMIFNFRYMLSWPAWITGQCKGRFNKIKRSKKVTSGSLPVQLPIKVCKKHNNFRHVMDFIFIEILKEWSCDKSQIGGEVWKGTRCTLTCNDGYRLSNSKFLWLRRGGTTLDCIVWSLVDTH